MRFYISNKFSNDSDIDGLLDGELPLRTMRLAKKFVWVFFCNMEKPKRLFSQSNILYCCKVFILLTKPSLCIFMKRKTMRSFKLKTLSDRD